MTLPGMDLQSQYNQTLQNTIGQSQAERLRQTRQQQSIANTDWQQRGVGEGAKRMAGFQEVNPSEMPNMSGDTRSFIQPLLSNYQEGGKQVEGYYGSDNPYTQGGLESLLSKQGYARAPSSLGEQFKSVGLKLPNAYGQDYYSAAHEDVGNKISAYHHEQAVKRAEYERQLSEYNQRKAAYDQQQSEYQKALQQQAQSGVIKIDSPYNPYKDFIPEKNNGEWIWHGINDARAASAGINPRTTGPIINGDDGQDLSGLFGYIPNNGYWSLGNSSEVLGYTPEGGYNVWNTDPGAGGILPKLIKPIVMATLGAMTGGAGYAAAGGAGLAAGVAGGAAGALPSAMYTGFNTGDWGKALEGVGLGAATGGMSGAFGKDLANVLGLSGQGGTNIAKGLISGATTSLGNVALGNKVNYQDALLSTLSNVGSSYLGDLTSKTIGGSSGDIFGGAVGGFSGNALKNILQGKSLDIGTALSTLQGATGGLGKLFSNTNEDKQSVNGPTSLARTLQGVKNGPAATFRRT